MYNLIKFIRNTSDQYVTSAETKATLKSAKIAYHQNLAAFYNADDVKIATVKIEDEFGHELDGFSETVDNTVNA